MGQIIKQAKADLAHPLRTATDAIKNVPNAAAIGFSGLATVARVPFATPVAVWTAKNASKKVNRHAAERMAIYDADQARKGK